MLVESSPWFHAFKHDGLHLTDKEYYGQPKLKLK